MGGRQIWVLVREEIRKKLEIMLDFGDMLETNADKHKLCYLSFQFVWSDVSQETS
jgi:hypothetical protein